MTSRCSSSAICCEPNGKAAVQFSMGRGARIIRVVGVVIGAWLLSAGVVGAGDATVTLTVKNDSTRSLAVTFYDLTRTQHKRALTGEKINSYSSVAVVVNTDAGGHAHIGWSAATATSDPQLCGRGERDGLGEADEVAVSATTDCAANTQRQAFGTP